VRRRRGGREQEAEKIDRVHLIYIYIVMHLFIVFSIFGAGKEEEQCKYQKNALTRDETLVLSMRMSVPTSERRRQKASRNLSTSRQNRDREGRARGGGKGGRGERRKRERGRESKHR